MKKIALFAAIAAAGMLAAVAAPPPGGGKHDKKPGKHGKAPVVEIQGTRCRTCGGDGMRRTWYGARHRCEICSGTGIIHKPDAHGPKLPTKHKPYAEKETKPGPSHLITDNVHHSVKPVQHEAPAPTPEPKATPKKAPVPTQAPVAEHKAQTPQGKPQGAPQGQPPQGKPQGQPPQGAPNGAPPPRR